MEKSVNTKDTTVTKEKRVKLLLFLLCVLGVLRV